MYCAPPNIETWLRTWYLICWMLLCACAYGVKPKISLDTADSATNAVVKRSVLFLLTSVVQNVPVMYTMDFVSANKNTLLLHVTVCEKVVPRLNKHDDVIELKFMKIVPPEMKNWLRPCSRVSNLIGSFTAIYNFPAYPRRLERSFYVPDTSLQPSVFAQKLWAVHRPPWWNRVDK